MIAGLKLIEVVKSKERDIYYSFNSHSHALIPACFL